MGSVLESTWEALSGSGILRVDVVVKVLYVVIAVDGVKGVNGMSLVVGARNLLRGSEVEGERMEVCRRSSIVKKKINYMRVPSKSE